MVFVGIDLSTAADAGRRLWIAEGEARRGRLAVTALRPARALPGGAVQRAPAFAALCRHLGGLGEALVGIDAPNCLPPPLASGDWATWLAACAGRHPSADAFRADCQRLAGGREFRGRSATLAKVPFAAWNLRLFRQTWHALADLYAPLVAQDAITVAPFQTPRRGRPRLAEICPASTLKHLGLYRSYKGRDAARRDQRAHILRALSEFTPLRLPDGLAETCLADDGGDALDAVVALAATWRCAEAIRRHDPASDGEVYVWGYAGSSTGTPVTGCGRRTRARP